MMTSTSRLMPHKIIDIEHLRAIAILFVLIAHVNSLYHETPHWYAALTSRLAFWGGVDLFFVISGFVIFNSLLPQWSALPAANIQIRLAFVLKFWLRRVRRLLPAAWFWAFFSLGVIAIFQRAVLRINSYEVAAALLQIFNLQAYICAKGRAVCSYDAVGVYWSLSLEEQIYVVLPILMVFFKRRIEFLLLGMLAASLALEATAPLLSGYLRFDGFCWGMLLALLYNRPHLHGVVDEVLLRPLGRLKYLAAGLVLVALPAIGVGAIVPSMSYPVTAVCCMVLVLLASYDQNYVGLPRLMHGPLQYVGSRSYSIYLVHTPVFHAVRGISGGHGHEHNWQALVAWPALAVVLTVALSELSYRLIEQRFRYGHVNVEGLASARSAAAG